MPGHLGKDTDAGQVKRCSLIEVASRMEELKSGGEKLLEEGAKVRVM
jgi:hypothetical protein